MVKIFEYVIQTIDCQKRLGKYLLSFHHLQYRQLKDLENVVLNRHSKV